MEKVSQVQRSINAIEKQKEKLLARIRGRIVACLGRLEKDKALLAELTEEHASLGVEWVDEQELMATLKPVDVDREVG